MKVLHFTNKPIFPTIDGGCLAMKKMQDLLVSSSEIEYFHYTLSTEKHPFSLEEYPKLKNKMYHTFIDTRIKPIKAVVSLLKNKTPYNVERFFSNQVNTSLKEMILENEIEYVIAESIYVLPYLNTIKNLGVKCIVRTHNIEYHIWQEKAVNEKNSLKKLYYNKIAQQLKAYEENILSLTDGVISISDEDGEIQAKLNDKHINLYPTFSTIAKENDYTNKEFYFLGAMDWQPNVAAINWIINDVIGNKKHNFKIHIAGKSLDKNDYKAYDYIVNHGTVNSAEKFISEQGICIVPILSGGGVKMKLLEALAFGKAVITTSQGAKGVKVEQNKEVLIANNASSFFEAMTELSNNPDKRKALGTTGKQFLNDNFGKEKNANKLVEFLSNI